MIHRLLMEKIRQSVRTFPAVWVTGPRQSGKTTLVQAAFPEYRYISLEDMDNRNFARRDPRGFLKQYESRVILDEVQRCPDLLSYLQTHMDAKKENGQFILTGSHQFQLASSIKQSLAGRVAVTELLPLSLGELYGLEPGGAIDAAVDLNTVLFRGMYPAVHDRHCDPVEWYGSYYTTYLERDVLNITAIHDLEQFDTFMRLCAARTGSILNYTDISNACGITVPTVKNWCAILRMSGIIRLIQPYFVNYSKRLVKAPKIHFLDSGLVCHLLNITEPGQLAHHPLRGGIFESFILAELIKSVTHRGGRPAAYYWRESNGKEIDILVDKGLYQHVYEVKSSFTVNEDFKKQMIWWLELAGNADNRATLVYGGDDSFEGSKVAVRSWRKAF